ncbi:Tigger transposable element-derived protein 4 [Oopsacas minuta]|uniref:Tigger transposable element-derived protein 4 n=1 Tax=Oopsacas minuta TaxID=111878 RepID=A0AAV7K136_9METZ|nr:Tigger transposable element-derived protein 4 [Oopsacas minuta]
MSKRTDLLISEKIALLKKFRSQPRGTSQRKLCELFGVPKSTVSKLLNEETLLTERWTLEQASLGKRKRDRKDPEVEEALNLWFSAVLTKGIRISGPILKNKAEELAQMLGRSDFEATDGWLSRWKKRHTIKYKRAHGEKGSADTVEAEKWMSIVFLSSCASISPTIFTMRTRRGCTTEQLQMARYVTLTNSSVVQRRLWTV